MNEQLFISTALFRNAILSLGDITCIGYHRTSTHHKVSIFLNGCLKPSLEYDIPNDDETLEEVEDLITAWREFKDMQNGIDLDD